MAALTASVVCGLVLWGTYHRAKQHQYEAWGKVKELLAKYTGHEVTE